MPNKEKMKYFAALVGLLCVLIVQIPTGIHAEEEASECDSSIASYINKKIAKLLKKYPEKQYDNLRLTLAFNDAHKKLSNTVLKETELKPGDCDAAEEVLESFKEYAHKYDDASAKLEAALEYLRGIDQDSKQSLQTKLDALKLEKEILGIAEMDNVDKVLEKYQSFKSRPAEPEQSASNAADKESGQENKKEEKAVAVKDNGNDKNESAYKHAFEQIMHIIMNVKEKNYGNSILDDDDFY